MKSTYQLFSVLILFTILSCVKEDPDKQVYIYGTVKDSNTDEPLSGAKVYFLWYDDPWPEKIDSTSTDESGYYEIAVDFGAAIFTSYSMGAEHPGYSDKEIGLNNADVPISEHTIIEMNFRLTP